jgi:hypothetical protein
MSGETKDKKILIVGNGGVGACVPIGHSATEIARIMAELDQMAHVPIIASPTPEKSSKEEIVLPYTKLPDLIEPINYAEIEKSGIRGVTNNRKRKQRKKKGKKTHRKKKWGKR